MQYKSSKAGELLTGLEEYVERMQEGQKTIYYIASESETLAANSPFVEALQKKGIEVRSSPSPL